MIANRKARYNALASTDTMILICHLTNVCAGMSKSCVMAALVMFRQICMPMSSVVGSNKGGSRACIYEHPSCATPQGRVFATGEVDNKTAGPKSMHVERGR